MRTLLLVAVFLLTTSFPLRGQTEGVNDNYTFEEILVTTFSSLMLREEDNSVDGSEYLFDDWASASMMVKLGTHEQEISFSQVRYNIERDLVEVFHNQKPLVTEGNLIVELLLNEPGTGKLMKLVPIDGMAKYSTENFTGLCHLMADGPVKLIRHFSKELLAANYDVALDVGEKKDRLVHIENTYLVKGGLFLKVNGRKDIVDSLHDIDIKSFIKKEKLNFRSDEDMIKAVRYYNETINSGSG